MNISFIEKFVDRQLNVLPPVSQTQIEFGNSQREDFINVLSNNGEYKNLQPMQKMFDQDKITEMKRNMKQDNKINDDGR